MSLNWIIPFCLGILVGQEITDIPKFRPYVEAGIEKLVQIGKEISTNAEKRSEESRKKSETIPNKRYLGRLW